jgi:hypothetical protein
MVRYFYAWTPLAIVGAIVFLALPWLGLIALLLVSLVALAALAFAVVLVPYLLAQAVSRRLHGRLTVSPQPAPVLPRATSRHTFQMGYVS